MTLFCFCYFSCNDNCNADIENSPLIDFDENYYEEEEEEEKALMSFDEESYSPDHSWFNRCVWPSFVSTLLLGDEIFSARRK